MDLIAFFGLVALVMRFAAPVAFAAIGEAIGQRSGVINIGLEGMMLTAAYFAMLVSELTQNVWLGMVAGIAVAVVLGAVQAVFTLVLAADQIVVGTAINLFAIGLTGSLFHARYGRSGQLISVPQIPKLIGDFDIALFLLVGLAVWATWMLARTRRGLVVRAVGDEPSAVEASGFSVLRVRAWSVLVSSVLAGLGGAYLALGVAGSFSENMTNGRGFIAIAMVTFGRWKPIWVLVAALLVGYLEWVKYTLQVRDLAVPSQLLSALPYLFALAVLVLVGKGTLMPAALAVPYKRNT